MASLLEDCRREESTLMDFFEEERQRLSSVSKKHSRAVGRWEAERKLVLVTRPKGKQLQIFGFSEKGATYLQPEEALYLMEMGDLEVETQTIQMTKQQMYGIVMEQRIPLDAYQVFSELCRAGFVVRTKFIDVLATTAVVSPPIHERQPAPSTLTSESDVSTEVDSTSRTTGISTASETAKVNSASEKSFVPNSDQTENTSLMFPAKASVSEDANRLKSRPTDCSLVSQVTPTAVDPRPGYDDTSSSENGAPASVPPVGRAVCATPDTDQPDAVVGACNLTPTVTECTVVHTCRGAHSDAELPPPKKAEETATFEPFKVNLDNPVPQSSGVPPIIGSYLPGLTKNQREDSLGETMDAPIQKDREGCHHKDSADSKEKVKLIIRSLNDATVHKHDLVLERGKLFFEVFARTKSFKKSDPGTPLCYVAVLSGQSSFPTGPLLQSYRECLTVKTAQLNFAVADEGTVAYFSTAFGLVPNLQNL